MLAHLKTRGFGIDATVRPEVVARAAAAAERAGYSSFWLNGSPPGGSLEGMAAAAEACSLPIGTGVLPLEQLGIEAAIAQVKALGIPSERFAMGVGYGRPRGALAYVRRAVGMIRDELGATPVMAAFGPRMTALAGEISEGVIFTFWFEDAVRESVALFQAGAEAAGRAAPPVISYVRAALLPQAAQRVDEIAGRYDAIPKFRALYARHGIRAHDTVVTGRTRAELLPGIEREAAVLDHAVVRAITADESADAILELLEAAAPGG